MIVREDQSVSADYSPGAYGHLDDFLPDELSGVQYPPLLRIDSRIPEDRHSDQMPQADVGRNVLRDLIRSHRHREDKRQNAGEAHTKFYAKPFVLPHSFHSRLFKMLS